MPDAGIRHRVHFEGTPFILHRWSGISRYFTELIVAFDADPSLGVDPVTPYRFVTNKHLATSRRGVYALPLPRNRRRPVLDRLNQPFAPRGDRATMITHYPLYEPHLLDGVGEGPAVVTVYDFTIEARPELFGDASEHLRLKRAYFEACDALVCISEATRDDLFRFHPDLDKPVTVTPLAVSHDFARPAARRPRGLPERYLLHVGNRSEHKNVELVFEAFRRLAATDPDLYLVLSGQGLPGEKERIAELGIADRTKIVRLSDRALPAAYRYAQALFFPSRYEGFGLPVLEAMTAGCPAVISDNAALVEVAGDAAEVVGADDVDGAVTALQRIIGDRQLADRLREAGRVRARDFSWTNTARLTVAAYDDAVGRRVRG